ncbi:MAG: tripartite tricarboxylate transporter TctB family protein [Proteobacteria bacterium]|nr:tripartite tricarboxylate transporter TctB family protein [Pseudomonadota bacterium]
MGSRLLRAETLAGGLFVLCGALAVALAWDYPMGDMRRMGPGWVPSALGWALVVLGGGIGAAGFFARAGAAMPERDTRPLTWLLLGVAAFALLLEHFGLVAAIFACVGVARLAERPYRPVETLALAAFLAALGAGIFVLGLGLPIPLFGR